MERQDEVVRGSKHYVREFMPHGHGGDVYWYRISKKYIRRDGKKVPYVPLEKRDLEKHEWGFIHLSDDGKKRLSGFGKQITEKKLIRKLEGQFDLDERERLDELSNTVRAIEEARNPSPPTEIETPEKPQKKAPVLSSTDGEIKRDKHGVKLFSYGGKYYFTMCVNKSMKYPDHTSLRFSMAGKNLLFTLGKSEVKALVREAHRGLTTGELMEILGKGRK